MSKAKKRLAAVRNSPHDVRFRDLIRLVEALGFTCDRLHGTSHAIYAHPTRPEILFLNLQPGPGGKAKRYQVEQLLDRVSVYGLDVE